jgi:hypothetical protein
MTEDFERDVEQMLRDRAGELPGTYDAPSDVVSRARRRRTVKVGALTMSVVLVVAGGVAAIAGVAGRNDSERVTVANPLESTTTAPLPTTTARVPYVPTTSVPTVACPVLAANSESQPAPPNTAPRTPAAGDPAGWRGLVSFAGAKDARYVALGPKSWSCLTQFAQDGNNDVVLYPPGAYPGRVPSLDEAPIAVDDDWLWHGLFPLSCQVSNLPAVLAHAAHVGMPCALPSGRRLTQVDTHVSTFVDTDGTQGAAWLRLPSSADGVDGLISVVTCRPTTGLTAAECGTIVDDYIARVGAMRLTAPGRANP